MHQSRNTLIARTLRELGYMREMGEGFRRIFQLMRAHDLVEPDILADDQSFVVSLRHRSVFSDEDQRWIAAYEYFNLERDEEKVLLLGRTGEPLSVKQIMDAVDLVDTEDYRALIARLQQKGLIQSVKRHKSRGRTRNSPRWIVVQPKDANRYYGELLRGAQETYKGGRLAKKDFLRIGEFITDGSPYNREGGLEATFRQLGLTDVEGHPTSRLGAVLEQRIFASREEPIKEVRSRMANRVGDRASRESGWAEQDEQDLAEASEVALSRQPTKIFVGNLAYESSADDLRTLFARVGQVIHVSVPMDFPDQNRNRGYGFVEMRTSSEAKRCKSSLEGTELNGRRLQLEWATRKLM